MWADQPSRFELAARLNIYLFSAHFRTSNGAGAAETVWKNKVCAVFRQFGLETAGPLVGTILTN